MISALSLVKLACMDVPACGKGGWRLAQEMGASFVSMLDACRGGGGVSLPQKMDRQTTTTATTEVVLGVDWMAMEDGCGSLGGDRLIANVFGYDTLASEDLRNEMPLVEQEALETATDAPERLMCHTASDDEDGHTNSSRREPACEGRRSLLQAVTVFDRNRALNDANAVMGLELQDRFAEYETMPASSPDDGNCM
jgi:hypothetical protein